MAYIVMAYTVTVQYGYGLYSYGPIVMAFVVMAHIVMAFVVMAHIVMAFVVMAYVVMARTTKPPKVYDEDMGGDDFMGEVQLKSVRSIVLGTSGRQYEPKVAITNMP